MQSIHPASHTFQRRRPDLIDQRREAAIAAAVDDLLSARDRLHRIVACRALNVLARSPRQIQKLEQRGGLMLSAPAYVDGHYIGAFARREAA